MRRDRRGDCVQVVIALVVTPEGLPLACEMLPGNTADKTTLKDMLALIEKRHGKARRVWVTDRGVPAEETLALMRASQPPIHYLVGTPKARLRRLEAALSERSWVEVREHLRVKNLAHEGETYICTESAERINKERSMRRRALKAYWKRLRELSTLKNRVSREGGVSYGRIFLAGLESFRVRLPLPPGGRGDKFMRRSPGCALARVRSCPSRCRGHAPVSSRPR